MPSSDGKTTGGVAVSPAMKLASGMPAGTAAVADAREAAGAAGTVDKPLGAAGGRGRAAGDAGRFDCLVAGVGGQGVVLASRIVAAACMARGSFVRTAETIGMSQRGGGVTSHVRVAPTADDLPSSMIPRRGAHLVLAFEPGEAVRAYGLLAPGGSMVCATRPVVPSAAATSGYDGRAQVDWLRGHVGAGRFVAVDPAVLDDAGLSPKCANVLLLGAAAGLGALPFGEDELRAAVRQLVKPAFVEMNERALALGAGLARR